MDVLRKSRYIPLTQHGVPTTTEWQPGMRNFPWLTALSLGILVVSIASSVAIIVASDTVPVKSWKLNPAVLLAIASGIFNAALAFTFSQGAAITWWRAALHGTTLRDLHFIWSFGKSSFRPPSRLSRTITKMALVALIVTLVTITNNPLLQRATRVRNGVANSTPVKVIGMMKDPLAQPYGTVQQTAPANMIIATTIVAQMQQWYKGAPIRTVDQLNYTCNGTCEGSAVIPGVQANCTSSGSSSLNLANSLYDGEAVFSIKFARYLDSENHPVLSLDVLRADTTKGTNTNCVATIIHEHCDILAVLVQRSVEIINDTIALGNGSQQVLSQWHSSFDAPDALDGTLAGPLAMLHWFGTHFYTANWTLNFGGIGGVSILAHGVTPVAVQFSIIKGRPADGCSTTFSSPVATIIRALEEVLFRVSLDPGTDYDWPMENRTIQTLQTTPVLVFRSDFTYLGIAAVLMIAGLLAVLVPLWGWWELGRSVDLSPLETANAFGAPLINKSTAANDTDHLVSDVGDVRVRYGVVTSYREGTGTLVSRLRIGEHDRTEVPLKGQNFGDTNSSSARSPSITTTELSSFYREYPSSWQHYDNRYTG